MPSGHGAHTGAPTAGSGGIMISGHLSVRGSVRPNANAFIFMP